MFFKRNFYDFMLEYDFVKYQSDFSSADFLGIVDGYPCILSYNKHRGYKPSFYLVISVDYDPKDTATIEKLGVTMRYPIAYYACSFRRNSIFMPCHFKFKPRKKEAFWDSVQLVIDYIKEAGVKAPTVCPICGDANRPVDFTGVYNYAYCYVHKDCLEKRAE